MGQVKKKRVKVSGDGAGMGKKLSVMQQNFQLLAQQTNHTDRMILEGLNKTEGIVHKLWNTMNTLMRLVQTELKLSPEEFEAKFKEHGNFLAEEAKKQFDEYVARKKAEEMVAAQTAQEMAKHPNDGKEIPQEG